MNRGRVHVGFWRQTEVMAEPWTPALSIREAAVVDLRWFDFLYELGSIARGDDIRERVFLQAA